MNWATEDVYMQVKEVNKAKRLYSDHAPVSYYVGVYKWSVTDVSLEIQ